MVEKNMKCTRCGFEIPEDAESCPRCSMPGIDGETHGTEYRIIHSNMKKARWWFIAGLFLIAGIICFPVSYWFATEAITCYEENKLNDYPLKRRILRMRFFAGLMSGLSWFIPYVILKQFFKS